MAKRTDQLATLVEKTLEVGEELIATTRVNYNGTIPSNQFTVSTRMLEHDQPVRVEVDPDSTAFFPTANQMALALTGGRLFVWSLGISGKPKQFLGVVPMNSIAAAKGAELGGGRQSLRVVMKSGAMVDLEFMRGEAGGEFLQQLQALVGPSDSADPAPRDGAGVLAPASAGEDLATDEGDEPGVPEAPGAPDGDAAAR